MWLQKNYFFYRNLFSSMLWTAHGGDGTELDQIKHSTKPNLTQQMEKDYFFFFFSTMGSLI